MQEKFDFGGILKNERFLEAAVLLLFVASFIFLKLAQPWGYQLSHDYPVFYNANDNFVNGYVYPQYIKETGSLKYEPPYITGYEDMPGNYPPILFHLSAMLSLLSGLETYDATNLIVVLFSISIALLIYFLIRKQSPELAVLSIPFMIGMFNFDFEIARVFGLWIFIIGALFLAAVIWLAERLSTKHSFVLLTIFLSGAALGHASELVFAFGFLAVYFLLKYFKDKALDRNWIKNAAFGSGIFLVLSAYYLIIFKYTWMAGAPFKFEVMDAPPFAPNFGVKLTDFGIILPLLIAGIFIGLKRLAFRKKEEFPFSAIAAGLFMLVIGYTNYVGFGVRAWQTRIFWPVYFAVFSGIVVYSFGVKFRKAFSFRYAVMLSIILLVLFSFSHYGKLQGGGVVDQKTWDALMWIKQNTPEDAKIAHFLSPYSEQPFSIWSTERMAYIVSREDYIDKAQSGIVGETYAVSLFNPMVSSYDSANNLASFLGYPPPEAGFDTNKTRLTTKDVDYYVLLVGGASVNPAVLNYNGAIREQFIKMNASEVYNNGEVSVLLRRGGTNG